MSKLKHEVVESERGHDSDVSNLLRGKEGSGRGSTTDLFRLEIVCECHW